MGVPRVLAVLTLATMAVAAPEAPAQVAVIVTAYHAPSQLLSWLGRAPDGARLATDANPWWPGPAGLAQLSADDASGVVVAAGTADAIAEVRGLLQVVDAESVPLVCKLRRLVVAVPDLLAALERTGVTPVALPGDRTGRPRLVSVADAPLAKLSRALDLLAHNAPPTVVARASTAGEPTVLPLTNVTGADLARTVRTTRIVALARPSGGGPHPSVTVRASLDLLDGARYLRDGSVVPAKAPTQQADGMLVRLPWGNALLLTRNGPDLPAAAGWPLCGGEAGQAEVLLLSVEPTGGMAPLMTTVAVSQP